MNFCKSYVYKIFTEQEWQQWLVVNSNIIFKKRGENVKELNEIVVIAAVTISLNISITYGENDIAYMLVGYLCSFITDAKSS